MFSAEARTPAWYAARATAENTYKAYRSSLRDFVAWAGMSYPLPATPEMVASYLTDRAQRYAAKTLDQRLNALSFIHRVLDYPDPTRDAFVRQVMKGIRRVKAEEGDRENQAPAFSLEQFRAMLDSMGTELRDLRDRAYLLMGLFGGFRQSELTALTVDRLQRFPEGLIIPMGVVKQDQEARHRYTKAIPYVAEEAYCPVRALDTWLYEAGIDEGPLFRSVDRHGNVGERALSHTATNDIIKKWAARAGLPDAARYSGHSLRASFVTILREMGVPDAQIARQTHHRNLQMMNTYDRPQDAFRGNPASLLGSTLLEL